MGKVCCTTRSFDSTRNIKVLLGDAGFFSALGHEVSMRKGIFFILLCALISVACIAAQQESEFGLRLIVVRTEAEAADLRAEIEAGTSFDEVAREHSVDASSVAGGYLAACRTFRT